MGGRSLENDSTTAKVSKTSRGRGAGKSKRSIEEVAAKAGGTPAKLPRTASKTRTMNEDGRSSIADSEVFRSLLDHSTTVDDKEARLSLLKSVPIKFNGSAKSSKTLFVVSENREEIYAALWKKEVVGLNMFRLVAKLSHPKVLLVVLNRPEVTRQFEQVIKDMNLQYEIEENNPTQRLKTRLQILVGFSELKDKQSIKEHLITQNRDVLSDQKFTVDRIWTNSRTLGALLAFDEEEAYEKVIKKRDIHIGTSTCTAMRSKPMTTCTRCCLPGHDKAMCKSKALYCLRCAAEDHVADDCEKLLGESELKPCCINCKMRGEERDRHFATSFYCPFRLDFIDYMVSAELGKLDD